MIQNTRTPRVSHNPYRPLAAMDTAVVCSAAEAKHAEAGGDSTANNNETQLESDCPFQGTYSNNTDNQDNQRLSAVSNRAAAGPGGSGPCGNYSADMDPTAVGRMGPRGTTFADAALTSLATPNVDVGLGRSGVQHSAERTQFDPCYTNHHESDRSATSGGMLQATGVGHHEFRHDTRNPSNPLCPGGEGCHPSGAGDHLDGMNHPSQHRNEVAWSGRSGVQNSADGPGHSPQSLDVRYAYTAAAPASSCAPLHDVRHAEHRNGGAGSGPSGVQYSAVGPGHPPLSLGAFYVHAATAPASSFAPLHDGLHAVSQMPGFAPLHGDLYAGLQTQGFAPLHAEFYAGLQTQGLVPLHDGRYAADRDESVGTAPSDFSCLML
jgi:hypothetical protein